MLWVASLLLTAGLTGCLQQGEELDPTAGPSGAEADAGDADEDDSGTDRTASATDGADDTADEDESTSSSGDGENMSEEEPPSLPVVEDRPLAVIAHIDTGINPYHQAFRDDSDLADEHPCRYLDGYPCTVPALNLTLDAPSYEGAVQADRDVWANVTPGQLYWIPGTRIDGAITFGAGGTYCPLVGAPHDYIPGPLVKEAPEIVAGAASDGVDRAEEETGEDVPDDVENSTSEIPDPLGDCPEERPILDDFGHGTMTASRAAGDGTSLCPDCRLVSVEGLGPGSVRWVADQGWIDVQTNSWVSLVPPPANQLQDDAPTAVCNNGVVQICSDDTTTDAAAYAADKMVTVFASGNGLAYLAGIAPTPTYALSTAPADVVLVGAHDNGYVTTWSGSPPHVVADGYRGLSAANDSLSEIGPLPFTCCTSSSAPYAAGGAANLIEAAREKLDDTTNGIQQGVVATGPNGPLQDGKLTMEELKSVYFHTAEPRPTAGAHDGLHAWTATPTEQQPQDPKSPSGNPYCAGCLTAPIPYEEIPSDVPTYVYTGYGSISPTSDEHAVDVIQGAEKEPARPQADRFFELDQTVRDAYMPN